MTEEEIAWLVDPEGMIASGPAGYARARRQAALATARIVLERLNAHHNPPRPVRARLPKLLQLPAHEQLAIATALARNVGCTIKAGSRPASV